MFEELMHASFDGTLLRLRKDKVNDPKAVIVIAHGLCEHLNRYDYVTEQLNACGFSVYRYDQRGHGKSEGAKVFFSDFKEMAEDCNCVFNVAALENPRSKIFVLGHSMGGETVSLFGTLFPKHADGFILSGALTRYNNPLMGKDFPIPAPVDHYVDNALSDGVCSDPAVVEAYVKDPLVEKKISIGLINEIYKAVQFLREHPQDFVDPVLILHGANDGLVSYKDSLAFFDEIASLDKGLQIYPKLYHEILNEPTKDEVIADIVLWLNKHL